MFVFVKIFILFFFNVICCIHVGGFKKSLEELQTQANLLSATDKQNISPFIEKLFSFLPNAEMSIRREDHLQKCLKDSLTREDNLKADNQDLTTQRIDLSNRLINSQSKLQTAENAITEKDKKIKAFKSSRSKLQKVAYVTTIIAGVIVTYVVSRFYYDLYLT